MRCAEWKKEKPEWKNQNLENPCILTSQPCSRGPVTPPLTLSPSPSLLFLLRAIAVIARPRQLLIPIPMWLCQSVKAFSHHPALPGEPSQGTSGGVYRMCLSTGQRRFISLFCIQHSQSNMIMEFCHCNTRKKMRKIRLDKGRRKRREIRAEKEN